MRPTVIRNAAKIFMKLHLNIHEFAFRFLQFIFSTKATKIGRYRLGDHSYIKYLSTKRVTLISLINVEVEINVEGGIFWEKLVHISNNRGVEGGKI